MAQTQSPTNELYKKTAALLNAETMYLCCDSGNMTSFDATTNAPATEISTNGFSRQAGTRGVITTTVTNDTAQIYYQYTATANQNVNGHEVMSASATGNMYGWCQYAAMQPMQNQDTINCIMQFQAKIGA